MTPPARISPLTIRRPSNHSLCDVVTRVGWYVRYPNGDRGKSHKTRGEAAAEARWFNGQPHP